MLYPVNISGLFASSTLSLSGQPWEEVAPTSDTPGMWPHEDCVLTASAERRVQGTGQGTPSSKMLSVHSSGGWACAALTRHLGPQGHILKGGAGGCG